MRSLILSITAYLLLWSPSTDSPVVYGVFRDDSLIAETADTMYLDTTADTGLVEYNIGVRWGADSVYALGVPISATTVDHRQGIEPYRFVIYNEQEINQLAVYEPAGNWHVSYVDSFITFTYEFDYNRNGIVDLSDFGHFAETNPTPYEIESFLNMYGKQSIFRERI